MPERMRNLLTDVAGLKVGNADDALAKTGVTVVVCDRPAVGSVHVSGGAPGTRETDLLAPEQTVDAVDAVVLSGGSAFGLAAADGVVERLAAAGRGFPVGAAMVPIVPAAILFDLNNGGDKGPSGYPDYRALGAAAYDTAGRDFALGTAGAGTGATTANLKGGLGTASARLPGGVTVAALVAVNAIGQATIGDTGMFWAAPFERDGEFGGQGWPVLLDGADRLRTKGAEPRGNTTLAVVATDATLTKAEAKRLAIMAHDGFARALWPAHTPMDGDIVFALATGRNRTGPADLVAIGAAAAACTARAIARGIYAASAVPGDKYPTWQQQFGSGPAA